MTLISTACSWVNMFGGHKAAIFTQVGQFYFGTLGQFSIGVDTDSSLQPQPFQRRPFHPRNRTESKRKKSPPSP